MPLSSVFDADSASILDAMTAIDSGSASAAFAVTSNGVLVGVVTDGDIRRALLQGARMSDPVKPHIRRHPDLAKSSDSRSSILDMTQARMVSQVPMDAVQ